MTRSVTRSVARPGRSGLLRRLRRAAPAFLFMLISACGLGRCGAPRPLDPAATQARYAAPLAPPTGAMAVFHLGHSLVGRDMPAMLRSWRASATATRASSAGARR